jgi:hypothetical protein
MTDKKTEKELVKKEISISPEYQFTLQDFQIIFELINKSEIKGSDAELIFNIKLKIQKNAEFIQTKQ